MHPPNSVFLELSRREGNKLPRTRLPRASVNSRQRSLEAPAGLAERLAFAKAKSLRWGNLVHDGRTTFAVLAVKGAVAHREVEGWVVLRSVPIGYAPEPGLVAHHYSVALDHQVETL